MSPAPRRLPGASFLAEWVTTVLIAIAFLEFPLNGILQEVIFSSSATALLKGESIEEGGPVGTCPQGLAPARSASGQRASVTGLALAHAGLAQGPFWRE